MSLALQSLPAFEPSPYNASGYTVLVSGRAIPMRRLWPNVPGGTCTLLTVHHALVTLPPSGNVIVEFSRPIENVELSPPSAASARVENDRLLLHFPAPAKVMIRLNDGEPLFLIVRPPASDASQLLPKRTLHFSDYAADTTGVHSSTALLQRAIDDAALLAPGAVVVVPPGTYLTGSLWMRSGVTLHLEENALLVADSDDRAFPRKPYERIPSFHPGTDPKTQAALLWFDGVHNAGLSGRGTIDGQGHARRLARTEPLRLQINHVRVVDSRDIRLEGCLLLDSEFWSVHLLRSRHVVVTDLTILNEMPLRGWDPAVPVSTWNNTDGIVADACINVHVEDVLIHAGDDCLVVKTSNSGPHLPPSAHNIVFRRAVLASSTSAVKLGTESIADGLRNILAEDIHVLSINRDRALVIWPRDTAALENLIFRRIRIEAPHHWLQIDIAPRTNDQQRLATLENVIFEDIDLADTAGGFIRTTGSPLAFGHLRFRRITRCGLPVRTLAELHIEGIETVPSAALS